MVFGIYPSKRKRCCRQRHAYFTGQPNGEFICPQDWQRLPRVGSYGLVNWAACFRKSDAPRTWSAAMKDCRERRSGGHLLILDDEFYRRYVPTDDDDRKGLAHMSVGDVIVTHLTQFLNESGIVTRVELK